MICPRCRYEIQEHDPSMMPGVCPACGVAYNKWQEMVARAKAPAEQPRALEEGELAAQLEPPEAPEPWRLRVLHYLCFMPSDRHESVFWGHCLIYAIFFLWGWRFILSGIDGAAMGSSFLHLINLPFHEYGHLMFRPFGEWWMYLGGSLFQILAPGFPLFYFVVFQRDNFPASLMLWWSGQNFLDVAPYIADAPTRFLPHATGAANSHDWWNLLRMSEALDWAGPLSVICFALGVAVMLLAMWWGGFLLCVEWVGRTRGKAAGIQED